MLRRLIEAGSQVLFEKQQSENLEKLRESRQFDPVNQLDAISLHTAEGELIQRMKDAAQNQRLFSQEAYAVVSKLLQEYNLEDLPEEMLPEVLRLLLPLQQAEPDAQREPILKEKPFLDLTVNQEMTAAIIFRTGTELEKASMRDMVQLVYPNDFILMSDQDERGRTIQQHMDRVYPSRELILAKFELLLKDLGVDLTQPLHLDIDTLNQIPDESRIKPILQQVITTPGFDGLSWDQIKQLANYTKSISRVDPQFNLEILKTHYK